jgi:hypothetical protein
VGSRSKIFHKGLFTVGCFAESSFRKSECHCIQKTRTRGQYSRSGDRPVFARSQRPVGVPPDSVNVKVKLAGGNLKEPGRYSPFARMKLISWVSRRSPCVPRSPDLQLHVSAAAGCLRDSHIPSATIYLRSVSHESSTPCRLSKASAVSAGPKSWKCCQTSSTTISIPAQQRLDSKVGQRHFSFARL